MLKNLNIKNFILIDELILDFDSGLSVFSGETGAGKSIIMDAIKFIAGKNGSSVSLAKNISLPIIVTAGFEIDDLPDLHEKLRENFIDFTEDLIIKRLVSENKTKAFINDQQVTVKLQSEVMSYLIEIHGQHENLLLFNNNQHIKFLDQSISDQSLATKVSEAFFDWQETKRNLALLNQEKIKAEILEIDYLLEDFSKINLDPKYFEQLLNKKESAKKQRSLAEIYHFLSQNFGVKGKVSTNLIEITKILLSNKNKDEISFTKIIAEIEIMLQAIDRISESINFTEYSEFEIAEIDNQISEYRSLSRKYAKEIENFSSFCKEKKQQKLLLEGQLLETETLEKRQELDREKYLASALILTKARQEASLLLISLISKHLKDLLMEKVIFRIELEKLTENFWSKSGIEKAIFEVCTNPGSGFFEIGKIASGGELSRFMLALKLALALDHKVLIFDEIDIGVSGKVATAIGEKLKILSKINQIIVISHQAQIAAKSDQHFLVTKQYEKDNTKIKVGLLNDEDKLQEIARMISGREVTKEAIEAAKSLID